MMDEIKLKNGILRNCMNNEVTGFVKEDLKTNELLENILGFAGKKWLMANNFLYMQISRDSAL